MNPFRLAVPVTERDRALGPADAAVTLVEYGDYQCGHCGRAHPNLQALLAGAPGRLRLVFRHFPLDGAHPLALAAAEAAEAAGAQGRFWDLHDWLYGHQDALDRAGLERGATELGLDLERFRRDLGEHAHRERVLADLEGGRRSGVGGTPTFFVNGERHLGGYSLEELREAVGVAGAR